MLVDLYRIAVQNGIDIDYLPLPETESLAIEESRKCYIGMDLHLRGKEERVHLAHELGHCVFGGFYNRYSNADIREKAERRADKWAFKKLCPIEMIKKAKGFEPWELADFFGVTDAFMYHALEFYKDAGVL